MRSFLPDLSGYMKKHTIHLPQASGLFLSLKNLASIVPTNKALNRFRSGTKLGQAVRHIFDHQHLNKVLGSNLALAALAASVINIPNLGTNTSDIPVEDVIIKAETLALATEKGIRLPVETRKVTQGYRLFHPGVDLDGITGDLVWPIMKGEVQYVQYSKFAYGNAIIVDHGNDLTSLYAHLSKINVKEGQDVTTDTVIGLMGATGRSSGDHLHLEVRDNGVPINPLTLLPQSR